MNTPITKEVSELENLLNVCDAKPQGDDLPQVANRNQVILMVKQDAKLTK